MQPIEQVRISSKLNLDGGNWGSHLSDPLLHHCYASVELPTELPNQGSALDSYHHPASSVSQPLALPTRTLRSTFDEHYTYPMDASILIVGQDEFCQSILDAIQPSADLTLEVAPNPQEAFPLIQAQQPDLVILSLQQSGVMDLYRNIREKNRLTWIYCIVVDIIADDAFASAHSSSSLVPVWDGKTKAATQTLQALHTTQDHQSEQQPGSEPPLPINARSNDSSNAATESDKQTVESVSREAPAANPYESDNLSDRNVEAEYAVEKRLENMQRRQAQLLLDGADAVLALSLKPTPVQMQLLQSQIQAGLRRVQSHREIVRTNDLLSAIALSDPLTELNNRRAFEWELPRQIRNARDRSAPISLLMLDVDFFKTINDQYGHLVGDRALKLISARLRHNLRFYDTPFRYGGEEFVIILNNTTAKEAKRIGQRLCKLIATQAFNVSDSLALTITVSAGTASLRPDDDDKGINLLRRADQYLLKAKSQGRNRVLSAEDGAPADQSSDDSHS